MLLSKLLEFKFWNTNTNNCTKIIESESDISINKINKQINKQIHTIKCHICGVICPIKCLDEHLQGKRCTNTAYRLNPNINKTYDVKKIIHNITKSAIKNVINYYQIKRMKIVYDYNNLDFVVFKRLTGLDLLTCVSNITIFQNTHNKLTNDINLFIQNSTDYDLDEMNDEISSYYDDILSSLYDVNNALKILARNLKLKDSIKLIQNTARHLIDCS